MPSGRSIARVALSALLIAAAGLGAYWFVRSRTAAAAAPPSQMTVSPTQNVQQTVQVVVPGATPLKPAAPPALSPAASQPLGPASQPNPSDAHTTSTPTPVKIGDITFDVRTCRRVSQGVQCNFLITNAGEETHLLVYTWTRSPDPSVAFDAGGVSRTVVDAQFAGQRGVDVYGPQARLSPTVPTPLVVIFESTPAAAFDAVTLGVSIVRGYGREPAHAVVFRNVKIDG